MPRPPAAPAPAAPAAPAAAVDPSAPVSAPATDDFFPFIDSIFAVAPARSSSVRRDSFSSSDAIANDTAVATRIDSRIFTWSPRADCAMIASTDPGAAGATRPVPSMTFTSTPDMPPAMTARISCGRISTYGK